MPQGERLGAGRSGDVRREGGGGGGRDVPGGLAEDGRQRRVCRAEAAEEFSEECRPVGTVKQLGGCRGGWRSATCSACGTPAVTGGRGAGLR